MIAEQDVINLLQEATNQGRFIPRPEMRERLGITMAQDGTMRGVIQAIREGGNRVVVSNRTPPGGYRFALSIEEKEAERDGLRRQAWTLLKEATTINKQIEKELEKAQQMEMELAE